MSFELIDTFALCCVLVRGKQGTSFFPGPHQPNSSHDGSDSTLDCGTGQLYDILADSVRFQMYNCFTIVFLFVCECRQCQFQKNRMNEKPHLLQCIL